jgi:hypothetical protein
MYDTAFPTFLVDREEDQKARIHNLPKSGRSKLSSSKQEGRLNLLVDNGAGGRQTNFQCISGT